MNPMVPCIELQIHSLLLLYCPWVLQRNYWLVLPSGFLWVLYYLKFHYYWNKIIIIFFNCKVHIFALLFVAVSASSVWLLLQIFNAQLLRYFLTILKVVSILLMVSGIPFSLGLIELLLWIYFQAEFLEHDYLED